jgi:GT2 family glycosyltransferase
VQTNHHEIFETKNMYTISLIIPTYNEAENIIRLLDKIKENLSPNVFTEIIIVILYKITYILILIRKEEM